ncbi:hypothetical protein TSAR_014498 [Trichomalopsis sarcophagae]|uniref:Uncharacterized protein n=1 Tax=Trichomalopsis sarcophagae TaxID=543379 RepID=A0A232F756_9HYME|nr:hypothetical protein TSAR_014498 [Trichomalopsis sarcophagae]
MHRQAAQAFGEPTVDFAFWQWGSATEGTLTRQFSSAGSTTSRGSRYLKKSTTAGMGVLGKRNAH